MHQGDMEFHARLEIYLGPLGNIGRGNIDGAFARPHQPIHFYLQQALEADDINLAAWIKPGRCEISNRQHEAVLHGKPAHLKLFKQVRLDRDFRNHGQQSHRPTFEDDRRQECAERKCLGGGLWRFLFMTT